MTAEPNLHSNLEALAEAYARQLNALAGEGGFIREGVLKQGIVALVWAIYHELPDQREALIEALTDWEDPIRDAIRNEAVEKNS